MRVFRSGLILMCATWAGYASAKEQTPQSPLYLLELSGDNVISITINDQPVRLLIDPAAASVRGLNPDAAEKAKLKKSWIGFYTRIGPVVISSLSDNAKVNYGMATRTDRVVWPNRAVTTAADGIAGPGALPYQIVRFRLGNPTGSEKSIVFPMRSRGVFGFDPARTEMTIGGEDILISFSLAREQALVTAPTGNLIARHFGGSLDGQTTQTPIAYGISRPVSLLKLSKPLLISGRAVDPLSVRVSDFGDATAIPGKDAPQPDPDEIVVTTSKKKKLRHELTLGRAFLKGCSTLTYDFGKKQIILSCA